MLLTRSARTGSIRDLISPKRGLFWAVARLETGAAWTAARPWRQHVVSCGLIIATASVAAVLLTVLLGPTSTGVALPPMRRRLLLSGALPRIGDRRLSSSRGHG